MSDALSRWAVLLAVLWPLLLVAGVAFRATRPLAAKAVPWATLPALLTAAASTDAGLRLAGALLGSELVLDGIGRVFLLLNATLWLATGLLMRRRLSVGGGGLCAVLLLLAMGGGIGTVLAGDALLFFTASSLAGYALYGLLVHTGDPPARRAGRVLLVSLVVSDLVVFELLLLLGQAAGAVDFASLRQAFIYSAPDRQALLLGLLMVGFGIKSGVIGLHFWLAPVFITAGPALRPAVIGFMAGAGLLGWLRLLPLGEAQVIPGGQALQWLAWFGLGYAVLVGALQGQARSVHAYAAMLLSALWVGVIGAVLLQPQAWGAIAHSLFVAFLQSAFALAALLVLEQRAVFGSMQRLRALHFGVMWLAVWLLAAAPAGVAGALAKVGYAALSQMQWLSAAIAFLGVRGLLLAGADNVHRRDPGRTASAARHSAQASMAARLLAAGGLMAAALPAAALNLIGLSPAVFGFNTLLLACAAGAAWLSVGRLASRLPTLPPGDLLLPISTGLAAAMDFGRRLGDRRMPLWRDTWLAALRRPWSGVDWSRVLEQLELRLTGWRSALTALLVLGLVLAWWGGAG